MPGFDSTRDALSQGIVAAILVGVFAMLAADRVHRVLVPIAAVALVWLISYFTPFRLISFELAKEAVDLNVILLLFSMMALVGVLKTTNVFPWAVDRLLERSRGNPSRAARLGLPLERSSRRSTAQAKTLVVLSTPTRAIIENSSRMTLRSTASLAVSNEINLNGVK